MSYFKISHTRYTLHILKSVRLVINVLDYLNNKDPKDEVLDFEIIRSAPLCSTSTNFVLHLMHS